MKCCPIYEASKTCPNNIAVYTDNRSYTYAELNQMIDRAEDRAEIFYATFQIDSIVSFFSIIRRDKTPLPISIREPHLPHLDISSLESSVDTLMCTSGTMGSPKIAMHSLENHLYSAKNPHPDLALKQSDSYHLSLPINHIGGIAILFRAFCAGASIIIGDVHKCFATHFSFVPTQLKRFLASGERLQYKRLKAILVGGAPIPEKICNWAIELDIPLFLTYGMTETSSQFATARYEKEFGVHFGMPLKGREIKIDADKEIWVRGKTLFLGYLNTKTQRVDGWHRTNDLGLVGPNGLEILGRRDKMIISGGENIFLDELEALFLQIPQISSASISYRSCDEFGCRPVARVETTSPISISNIIAQLKELLPRYKIPDECDIHLL